MQSPGSATHCWLQALGTTKWSEPLVHYLDISNLNRAKNERKTGMRVGTRSVVMRVRTRSVVIRQNLFARPEVSEDQSHVIALSAQLPAQLGSHLALKSSNCFNMLQGLRQTPRELINSLGLSTILK